ncbi:hypothetical protein QF000_006492 [Paraburkholderia atlantica]|uniref:hypothetical protein n=1 Tax=Paraburkholderia atlantica TaxID=2654982 RepID=UPI003D20478D
MTAPDAISAKDILEWTFVIAALDLGVLGFIYNAYVTVRLLDEPDGFAPASPDTASHLS